MITAVTGMFRSGTSLVSRLLNIAGVYLGRDEDLKSADDSNVRGFFEHLEMIRINTALAAQFGSGYWEFPPLFPGNWPDHPAIADLRDDARKLVRSFSEYDSWGWKDPWTSVTLPLWRAALADEHLANRLRVVVCVRNPLDMAASAAANGPTPTARSVAAWHHYTEQVLLATSPAERVIVHYEDVLEDFRTALAPALGLIGLEPFAADLGKAERAQAFVDTGLRHHGHSIEDLVLSPDVPAYSRRFYAALREGPDSAAAFVADPERPAQEIARRRFLRESQVEWLDLPLRAQDLQTQVKILQGVLDTPQHRLVENTSRRIGRFGGLRKLAKKALGKK